MATGTSMLEGLHQAFQAFAQWEPENATEIDATLLALPDAFRTGYDALRTMAERLQAESAVHPLVRAEVEQAAAAMHEIEESFASVYSQHRVQHDDRMNRIENPQPGDEKWDVQSNR